MQFLHIPEQQKLPVLEKFKGEIVAVEVPQRKGDPLVITEDEEFKRVKFEKIPSLRPAFSKDGTVTAANASTINDGASALIIASEEAVKKYNLKPLAKIIAFADAAQEPQWFTTAPTLAAPKALKKAGMSLKDVDYFEVNEAFAVVTLAFNKVLDLDPQKGEYPWWCCFYGSSARGIWSSNRYNFKWSTPANRGQNRLCCNLQWGRRRIFYRAGKSIIFPINRAKVAQKGREVKPFFPFLLLTFIQCVKDRSILSVEHTCLKTILL